ncbi:MAG: helix-turn-helix domain-containing protein [Draconibacterium sp.]|nr:helix-turn-helix domain-containing protein [Draconibacterium sp.]
MPNQNADKEFLEKLEQVVKDNLGKESFGVSELAKELGMSRSSLHRKVNSLTKISVSQYIRQARLKQAKELLRQTSDTISEVGYKVGFSSTSYFIKCFHDYYGYSPGEVGNRENDESHSIPAYNNKKWLITTIAVLFVVIVAVVLFVIKPFSTDKNELEKSIAVLPFKNLSSDTTNVWFIEGLREDILDKLQNISDLVVISSTSADRYKNSGLSMKQIAKELNVSYVLEGRCQKTGNKVKLHTQLIVGKTDAHKWSDDYLKEINDENIYDIQEEVAIAVAKAINVSITLEEKKRIETKPTKNQTASEFYYKGLEF